MPDEETGSQKEPTHTPPPRYGFGGALADAWDTFTAHLRPSLVIFGLFHVLGALVSFTLLIGASSLGAVAVIPARLMALVVAPVLAGSLAVASLSRYAWVASDGSLPQTSNPTPRSILRPDILGLALVAAVGAVIAVLLLRGPAILVLPFFYGPPIAMQLAVTEELSLAQALQSARVALAGQWQSLLYLFAVSLALGLLAIVAVGGLLSLAGGRDDLGTAAALSLGRGLIIGVSAAFVGAMQIAIFRRLMEPAPVSTSGAATRD